MTRSRLVRRVFCTVLVTLTVIAASGCSASKHGDAVVPATNAGPTVTVLALGGSATEGDGVRNRLQQAWPYLVFHDALPLSAVLVNGALDHATVASAITSEAPLAAELKPDIVEVWLGADDLLAATPIPSFTVSFTKLVNALRTTATTRVLVGDLPAAYGSNAAHYNDAIHAVVTDTHAELVPLAQTVITLVPTDGLAPQPDTASHRAIATAFETVIKNHK
jgi:lysophospholipase L1-like esterase